MGAQAPYAGPYPGPYPGGFAPPARRFGALRAMFVGIAAVILALGVLLILVSLFPAAFGLHYASLFPFGGGFLGAILLLWGTLLLLRIAMRTGRRGRFGYGGPPGRRFDPAILAARQRYARGEITREQFQQIVNDLRRPPGPPLP